MYILYEISNKAFIQIKPDEVVITPDHEKATKYNTIGEAMRVASELNNDFESNIIRVVPIE